MSVGLPFAPGELASVGGIGITADGRELPAQIDVAATWRDGSVRWARASFTGKPGTSYCVEYGPGVRRRVPRAGLRVEHAEDGRLTVNTGAAEYVFLPGRLLPEQAHLGDVPFLTQSGDGAYLVDQQGRMARVAGPASDVTSEIVREGPLRVVIRRAGWYVSTDGVRVARARTWFYLAADSPALRITHSLVLTEDTNALWVRDYGLQFRTTQAPEQAVFSLGEPGAGERFPAVPAGGDVYMRQSQYPHFSRKESRAVIGQDDGEHDRVLAEYAQAGDWADATFASYGLTVVIPWLAQTFPKEIAFGPDGARAVFWSGRDGRELDFRTDTLIRETWRDWSGLTDHAETLARTTSNAQGAARTHDVWLLPRAPTDDERSVCARAVAAARPPLVVVDPVHFCASGAIGWPIHPVDVERFPEHEAYIIDAWERLMSGTLGFNGFIAWGCNPVSAGRISGLIDYGLRRHVWGLYGRSGDRRYYEYAARFNRFAGDWEIAHWTTGKKFKGGFTLEKNNQWPLFWGDESHMLKVNNSGHDIYNWLLEYYFTGDEYALELVRMIGDAMLEQWDLPTARWGSSPMMNLRVLTTLYIRDWDTRFLKLAKELLESAGWIDLASPNGLTDNMRSGALSKVDRNVLTLYDYYQATGYEPARSAILKAVDFQYRFNRIPPPVSYQNAAGLLLAVAFRWSGNTNYLRRVNHLVESALPDPTPLSSGGYANMHATLGLPAALGLLAESGRPKDPFPFLEVNEKLDSAALLFRHEGSGRPLRIGLFARFEDEEERQVRVAPFDPLNPEGPKNALAIRIEEEKMFKNPLASHFRLTLPADAPAGLYTLALPGARQVVVQESDAAAWSLFAPEGFLVGWNQPYYFRVPHDLELLEMNLTRPMNVRGPGGEIVVAADTKNIGRLRVPVAGRAGIWSVHATAWGFFRLLNGEPVFALGRPEQLPPATGLVPADCFIPPSGETLFVPGRADRQALHLAGSRRMCFPRGEATDAGYRYFPADAGTLEFWFRPNWSSCDLAITSSLLRDFTFVQAGSDELQYCFGTGQGFSPTVHAYLNLWARGADPSGGKRSIGCIGRHFFRAGQWHHVAATWQLTPDEHCITPYLNLFLDGKMVDARHGSALHGTSLYGYGGRPVFPDKAKAKEVFTLDAAAPWIMIGPLDGVLEQMRVSNVARYREDFTPPQNIPGPDANTLIFFSFNGSLVGESFGGDQIAVQDFPQEQSGR